MTNSLKGYDDYKWRSLLRMRPVNVMVEITGGCNLRCEYCYNRPKAPNEMTTEEIIYCFDELKRLEVLTVCLTGGEPFIRKDFFKILEEAQKRQFLINIQTNATLIDKLTAERLKKYPITKIQTSIRGGCAETHDRETGVPGSFDKLLKALEYLQDSQIVVTLSCVVTRHNQEELKEMKAIADRNKCVISYNLDVIPRLDNDRSPLSSSVSHDFRCRYWSAEFDCVRNIENPALEQRDFPPGKPNCNAGVCIFIIDSEGNLFPCALWRSRLIGNVFKDDIVSLWKDSPVLKEVRDIVMRIPHEAFSDEERPFMHTCPGTTEQIIGDPMAVLPEERIDIGCLQKRAAELKEKKTVTRDGECEKS